MLTAYFYNKNTWLPLTDPNVTVYVKLFNMNSDSIALDSTMTASVSFPGAFRSLYTLDTEIDYMAYYSCSDTSYVAQLDKLYIPSVRGGGGGGMSVNYSAINGHTTKKLNEIAEMFKDYSEDFSEIKSHIDLAKEEINDKIESIEIPESKLEEVEAKKALKLIQNVDKKLTSYIKSEMDEKEEIGALAREFTRQEMEDAKKEKEKELKHEKMMEEKKKMEEEEDKKLLELIKQEFATQEEQEKEEKRKELEKELEELEKEKKEKEKELNSLK